MKRFLLGTLVGLIVLGVVIALRAVDDEDAQAGTAQQSDPFAELENDGPSILPALEPAARRPGAPRSNATTLLPTSLGSAEPPPSAAAAPQALVARVIPVTSTLPEAFRKAGLPLSLLDVLDDAFLHRLDLYAHATAGTTITVWLDEDEELHAAKVPLVDSSHLTAALYTGPHAPPGWYDERGHALSSWLRARPLKLSTITSRFGVRLHPITGDARRHAGTDYGAPTGTPVFAAAAGRVRVRSSSKVAGLHVELQHQGGYGSRYLHLSRFADTIQINSNVNEGTIIGYVGSTGASTGPHLHYELLLSGLPLNATAFLPTASAALGPLALPLHRQFLSSLPPPSR